MKINKIPNNIFISDSNPVRFKEMGNISEIMYSSRGRPKDCPITRLNKEHYILNETGELKDFNHITNRSQALKTVAKTLQNGRDIINTNVTNVEFCRWITITYAENMTNTKKLVTDTDNLMRKLHDKYGKFEYITCNEPQGRGAWHIHMLMIFDYKAPFVPCEDLERMWGKGFCKVTKLDCVDNVGLYLTAYLSDVELKECENLNINSSQLDIKNVNIIDNDNEIINKRIVKGARLYLYPPRFRIFRWSRGIKKPNIQYLTNKDAQKKVSSAKLTYEKTIEISDNETNFKSILNYRYYNKK